MTMKKKSLIFLIASIVMLVTVSLVTVTYAWFLSRYSENYDFVLESESHVVLTYETALTFASGDQAASTNRIRVAELKTGVGMQTGAYALLDVFDVDTVTPAHTGKMKTSANAVKFTAQGAYWYGYGTDSGLLSFSLAAKPRNDSTYDLVHYGELDYVVIFEYMGYRILLFEGNYYTNSTEVPTTGGSTLTLSGSPLVLPSTATTFGTDGADPWYPIPENSVITKEITTSDNTERKDIFSNGLLLLPNTQFAITLYVFAAKADDFMDQAWNGQTIALEATISVPNPNE